MKKKKAAKAAPKPNGRPPFEPTDKQRGLVEALSALGMNQSLVATYPGIEIDEKTLREHFRHELDHGLTKLLASAVTQLGRMAIGAPAVYDDKGNVIRAEVKPELGAICFLLKTKGKHLGFSERIEVTGANGGAIKHDHTALDDVRAIIAEENKRPSVTKH